jgi:hypothetical protein
MQRLYYLKFRDNGKVPTYGITVQRARTLRVELDYGHLTFGRSTPPRQSRPRRRRDLGERPRALLAAEEDAFTVIESGAHWSHARELIDVTDAAGKLSWFTPRFAWPNFCASTARESPSCARAGSYGMLEMASRVASSRRGPRRPPRPASPPAAPSS